MNKPNQVVPSFASVFLTANQTLVNEVILFNILETDGTNVNIYDRTTGTFTSQISA